MKNLVSGEDNFSDANVVFRQFSQCRAVLRVCSLGDTFKPLTDHLARFREKGRERRKAGRGVRGGDGRGKRVGWVEEGRKGEGKGGRERV